MWLDLLRLNWPLQSRQSTKIDHGKPSLVGRGHGVGRAGQETASEGSRWPPSLERQVLRTGVQGCRGRCHPRVIPPPGAGRGLAPAIGRLHLPHVRARLSRLGVRRPGFRALSQLCGWPVLSTAEPLRSLVSLPGHQWLNSVISKGCFPLCPQS